MDGPEEELTQTDRAQPALYAISYALWETWLSGGRPLPSAAAGHSLGEYTALAASGAIGYLEGLALVAARGRAMAAAAAASSSGMAALLGVDEDAAETIAKRRRDRGGRLWVANLNAPGQIVVAGGEQDIAWVVAEGRELGVRRAVKLNVAGAFHSPYMEPAAQELALALEAVSFAPPRFPVWANATAAPHRQSEFADVLTRQLTSPGAIRREPGRNRGLRRLRLHPHRAWRRDRRHGQAIDGRRCHPPHSTAPTARLRPPQHSEPLYNDSSRRRRCNHAARRYHRMG